MNTTPTVSILIPAYNQPDLLERLVLSIYESDYRPIEIIISDDSSPNYDLRVVADKLTTLNDNLFNIDFTRQTSNLGVVNNQLFCVNRATGDFLLLIGHDNYLTDNQFLSRAVHGLIFNSDAHLYVANCFDVRAGRRMLDFDRVEEFRSLATTHVFKVTGLTFLKSFGLLNWEKTIGWSQVALVRRSVAHRFGIFSPPFAVDNAIASQLDLMQDNCMSFHVISAMLGNVIFDTRSVAAIETPESSYSSSSGWGKVANEVNFFIYTNILTNLKWIPNYPDYASEVYRYLDNCLFTRVNPKLIEYYEKTPLYNLFRLHCLKSIIQYQPNIPTRLFSEKLVAELIINERKRLFY